MDGLLVYDIKQRRPACVLLAAAMGGNPEFAKLWPAEHWIVDGGIEGLRAYRVTPEQLAQLVAEDVSASRRNQPS